MKRLYLQLNEPGSGEITVPLDSAQATNILTSTWVNLDYQGTLIGSFLVENIERTYTDSSENNGRILRVTGRGPLGMVDDAALPDWGTTSNEDVRIFWYPPDGTWPAIHHKGEILQMLMDEAMFLKTNLSGDTLDRKCWHDPYGNHLMAWAFTALVDSDGLAWDAAENVLMEMREGTSYLDVIRQFVALGQPTPGYVFEVKAVYDPLTNVTTLSVHQTAIGKALVNAVCHFRVGLNCTVVSDTENRTEIRNYLLLEFPDQYNPWSEVQDDPSILLYRRREMLLQTANASDALEADTFGNAFLRGSVAPKRTITLKITDAAGPKYGTDYNLGDWIYFDNGTGVEVAFRIHGIQLEWDDNWFADAVVELEAI